MGKCKICGENSILYRNRTSRCAKHGRFYFMGYDANKDGKKVPTLAQLETYFSRLDGMKCPHCHREMNWLRREGGSTILTLQHHRDGTMGLCCQACNNRHGKMDGDSFNSLKPGERECQACKKIKPFSDFWRAREHQYPGVSNKCKDCSTKNLNKWISANRERYNKYHREYQKHRRTEIEALK